MIRKKVRVLDSLNLRRLIFLSELVGKRLVWPPDGECWGRRLGTELCMFLLLEQTFSAAKAIEKKRNWRRRRLDRIRCLGGG